MQNLQTHTTEAENQKHFSNYERLLKLGEVIAKTGKSRARIYSDPTFPRPIKIGARASAWLESEINFWIAERISASRANAGE